jgi:hypothetical protein
MAIKHKVLKDFQLLTEDKKILILKAKTIIEDYKFKNKLETVSVPVDIIKNNPDYFSFIDWKEELQSYLKVNKIPHPAVITKKLVPFIETMMNQGNSTIKEVIVEKEVFIEKPMVVSDDTLSIELEAKLKKIQLKESQLDKEISETNQKEIEIDSLIKRYDQKEKNLNEEKSKLESKRSEFLKEKEEIEDLKKSLEIKENKLKKIIDKDEVIEIIKNNFKSELPEEFVGYFGNSLQVISVSNWIHSQLERLNSLFKE